MANVKAHEAVNNLGLQLKENASALATADSGHNRLYFKTDGALYFKDDAGTETKVATLTSGLLPMSIGGLNANISAFDGLLKVASGTASALKYNFAASVAPTVNDDSGAGYGVGSIWLDTTADTAFMCLDASVGAAVWASFSFPFRGFAAYRGSNQTVTANVTTKLNFDTEYFDIGGWFDLSTDQYTPLKAGYYQVQGHLGRMVTGGGTNFIELQKNGSPYHRNESAASNAGVSLSTIVYMNGSSDYLELYVNTNSTTVNASSLRLGFSAFLIQAG